MTCIESKIQNVLLLHYYVNGIDGVSLQMDYLKSELEDQGLNVVTAASRFEPDYKIELLNLDLPLIEDLRQATVVDKAKTTYSEEDIKSKISEISIPIKEQVEEIVSKEDIDMIYVNNLASLGSHIPAAIAMKQFAEENPDIPFVLRNYDNWWEGALRAVPQFEWVTDMLKKYHQWDLPNTRNIFINSRNKERFEQQAAKEAFINHDVHNFAEPYLLDNYTENIRKVLGIGHDDLVILQATRIVPRKGIELAIDFVSELERQKHTIDKLYDGRSFSGNIVFAFTNYAEEFALPYQKSLIQKMEEIGFAELGSNHLGPKYVFLDRRVKPQRGITTSNKKIYDFWDSYLVGDMITFPSLWEGFGNQALEAFAAPNLKPDIHELQDYFGKPVLVFEYPVWNEDISKEGYDVVSLGSELIQDQQKDKDIQGNLYFSRLAKVDQRIITKAVETSLGILTSADKYQEIAKHNFDIAKTNHGLQRMKDYVQADLNWASNF